MIPEFLQFLFSLPGIVTIVVGLVLYLQHRTLQKVNEIKRLNPNLPIFSAWFPHTFLSEVIDWLPPDFLRALPKGHLLKTRRMVYERENCRNYCVVNSVYDTMFVIGDPELALEACRRSKDFYKPIHLYSTLDFFGQNVITTEKEDWKKHHKIIAPTFSERQMHAVLKSSHAAAKNLVDYWQVGGVQNVRESVLDVTLSVIVNVIFGIEENQEIESIKKGKADKPFRQQLMQFINDTAWYAIVGPKALARIPLEFARQKATQFDQFKHKMTEILRDLDLVEGSTASLLKQLVKTEKDQVLTNDELISNMYLLMFAGHETTAGTLSFTLGYLAFHPEVLQRLRQEIDHVLKREPMQMKHMEQLLFLHACMNETLRLLPPVNELPKYTHTEQRLGELIIPPKCVLSLHLMGIHSVPESYSNAEQYNPSRWFVNPEHAKSASALSAAIDALNENETASDTLFKSFPGFIPFSFGPRACMGKKFAHVEFFCLLATIIQHFDWKPAPGYNQSTMEDVTSFVSVKSKTPIYLEFSRRQ
ncbi:cytochrome P450 [Gorgonomyces haynaldii]|nr:cytochrome P450 [Gorgonomyces haynaldii]